MSNRITWRQNFPAHKVGTEKSVKFAAVLLAVSCLLNLNDVAYMLYDISQAVSIVMLMASTILIIKRGRFSFSISFYLIISTLLAYLFFGTIFGKDFEEKSAVQYQMTYFASVLIIWAIVGFVSSLRTYSAAEQYTKIIRNLLLVSALSIWATPLLTTLYVNPPVDALERAGGFFGNANEAAYASLLCYAFCMLQPFRSKLLQIAAIMIASGATVQTFSKAGMTVLVLMSAAYLYRYLRRVPLFFVLTGSSLAIFAVNDLPHLSDLIANQNYIELSDSQRVRIQQLGRLSEGQLDEDVTTGRTYNWSITIERAINNFPMGSGLGTFHHIVGGILENGVWQGSHNTLLMLWGESGIVPPLLLIAAFATLLLSARRAKPAEVAFHLTVISVVLFADMMTGHGALGIRFHNFVLATVLGYLNLRQARQDEVFYSSRPTVFAAPNIRTRI